MQGEAPIWRLLCLRWVRLGAIRTSSRWAACVTSRGQAKTIPDVWRHTSHSPAAERRADAISRLLHTFGREFARKFVFVPPARKSALAKTPTSRLEMKEEQGGNTKRESASLSGDTLLSRLADEQLVYVVPLTSWVSSERASCVQGFRQLSSHRGSLWMCVCVCRNGCCCECVARRSAPTQLLHHSRHADSARRFRKLACSAPDT